MNIAKLRQPDFLGTLQYGEAVFYEYYSNRTGGFVL
jgi:hypothetical protein